MTRDARETALRRLALPRPALVETDPDGRPLRVDGRAVEQVRERWVVEEGWWTEAPARRAYAEVLLAGGTIAVVYRDLTGGGWHRQPTG